MFEPNFCQGGAGHEWGAGHELVSPFQADASFLYPLKKSGNHWFSAGSIEMKHWREMG